jgi:hypothetical protein
MLRWQDENGCYYDDRGDKDGWKVRKADGRFYHFDNDGVFCGDDEGGNDLDNFSFDEDDSKIQRKPKQVPQR